VLLEDANIITKGGSQGIHCFGLKKDRLCFVLKVLNGSEDVWPNIVASILEQIGYTNKQIIRTLGDLKTSIIRNDAGVEVGMGIERFSFIKSRENTRK
jgi:L-asparaginase II